MAERFRVYEERLLKGTDHKNCTRNFPLQNRYRYSIWGTEVSISCRGADMLFIY